jgi:hypothetical protein
MMTKIQTKFVQKTVIYIFEFAKIDFYKQVKQIIGLNK